MKVTTGTGVVSVVTGTSTNCVLVDGTSTVCGAGSGTVTSVGWTGGLVTVANPTTTPAFTVAGTSGGVPYFSGSSTWASSGALTANLPVIGGGAGAAPTVGTRSGNTTAFVTTTGTQTSGDCVKIDASGNHVANGSACAGTPPYSTTVSAQTSVSISAATHGQGVLALGACFDSTTPRIAVACAYTRNTSGDLVFTFSPAFTGQIQVTGAGGGTSSISGLTPGCLSKAATSSTLGDSIICESGTVATVTGTLAVTAGIAAGSSPPSVTAGTGGVWAGAEGTVPSVCSATSVGCLYMDSTQHGLLASFNNGSYLPVPRAPASTTSGNLASFNAANGGLLADSGVVATTVQTKAATQSGAVQYCAPSSASATTYTCTLTPTLTAYTAGMNVSLKIDTACTGSTATTLNIDTLGAKNIYLADGSSNPASGDCLANRQLALRYDGTAFRIIGGGAVSAGTTPPLEFNWMPGVYFQSLGNYYGMMEATGGTTLTNVSGSAVNTGSVGFPSTGSASVRGRFIWPAGVTSADAEAWAVDGCCGSGNLKLDYALACYAAGALDMNSADPTYNTAATQTTALGGGNPYKNSVTGVTKTGCDDGDLAFFRVQRDTGVGSNASGTLNIIQIRLVLNR